MVKLKQEIIEELMNRAARKLHAQGDIRLSKDEELTHRHAFCFDPKDVAEVHTHKQGAGHGIWFRLNDGRVFDKTGDVSDYDPHLYDPEQS